MLYLYYKKDIKYKKEKEENKTCMIVSGSCLLQNRHIGETAGKVKMRLARVLLFT
jgi:hypothetical protein